MTLEQISALKSHVAWHKPLYNGYTDEEIHYLDNGMIVEFTNCETYSSNCKFQINHENRYIWFSQLCNIYIQDDLTRMVGVLTNKNGENKQIIKFSDLEFWNEVKGKKYEVEADGIFYIVNMRSQTAKENHLFSHQDIYEYVKKCVDNNRIGDIGDCLKTAQSYSLIEK